MASFLFQFFAPIVLLIRIWLSMDLVTCDVIINEVNPDNPGTDTTDFFELYNTDPNPVSLDGYVVVFWQGGESPVYAYNVFNLSGLCIDGHAFFLIGREAVIPKPNLVGSSSGLSGLLQNGGGKCDAVALYKGNPADYATGMNLTKKGLVDAVVYDKKSKTDSSMFFPALLPAQTPLYENENAYVDDESLSRCTGNDPFMLGQFELRRISPGASNLCNDNDPVPTNVETPPTTCRTTLLSTTTRPPSTTSKSTETATSATASTSSTSVLTSAVPIIRDLKRTAAFSKGGFVVRKGKLLQNHGLYARTARNMVRCVQLCVQHPQCLSVNFSTDQTVDNCQLNSLDTLENTVVLTDHTGFKYAEAKIIT